MRHGGADPAAGDEPGAAALLAAAAGTAGRAASAGREPVAARAAAERPPAEPRAAGWRRPLLAACALAALSLLGPAAPTYDPWAWIIWGREITQGDLVTTFGPSWKPLPVLFTTPFALAGNELAPLLWVFVARAGGLMALYAAFALARRIAGPVAGVLAAGGLALSEDFVRHFARGNSEGMLVALCLLAVLAHLEGRRTVPLALGFLAGLLRPEVWPFLGAYGLWLAWRRPDRRAWVVAAFLVTLALWFLPEQVGSGDWLRAAERALQTNADSAAQAERPFLEVFARSAGLLALPVWAGAVVAVGLAVVGRRRGGPGRRAMLALLAGAGALMVGVGLMTEFGFAGNLRYVSLPLSLVAVMAGVGWVWAYRDVAGRAGTPTARAAAAAVALAASLPLSASALAFAESMEQVAGEAATYSDLELAVAAAGGRDAFDACGAVVTGPFEVQAVAWALGRHGAEVSLAAEPPLTVIALRGSPPASDGSAPVLTRTRHWVVRRTC